MPVIEPAVWGVLALLTALLLLAVMAWRGQVRLRDQYQHWLEEEKTAHKDLQAEYHLLQTQYAALRATTQQKDGHFAEQIQQLENSRERLKQEFELLATEILERKGRTFTELNERSIIGLLQPMQTEMKGFRDKVEKIHEQELQQRAELRMELKQLQALNREITEQTHQLSTALQGQKKMQGNWGELILENVLDSAGLRPDLDYRREVSFTTDEGRFRPDVVVYLPQNKHLVIDAKTSLSAYTRYVNAEEDESRQIALREHCKAIAARIDELAGKNYDRLPGINSPDLVIMFIPIESAFSEAIRHDASLHQRAIERHILVATPSTLLTSLNLVRQLWRLEDQSRHTAELADKAESFYRKLNSFLNSMMDVGKKLDSARDSYDRALGQLCDGKGNLIKQAADFRDLGVAVKQELPSELTERAALELERSSEQKVQ